MTALVSFLKTSEKSLPLLQSPAAALSPSSPLRFIMLIFCPQKWNLPSVRARMGGGVGARSGLAISELPGRLREEGHRGTCCIGNMCRTLSVNFRGTCSRVWNTNRLPPTACTYLGAKTRKNKGKEKPKITGLLIISAKSDWAPIISPKKIEKICPQK